MQKAIRTQQETYNYLLQIRRKNHTIRRKQLLCEELRSSLGARAIQYDRDRVQTSPTDKVSEIICKVIDLEEQIERLQLEKAKLVMEINAAVEQLEDEKEAMILTAYYIRRLTMEQVAAEMGYSLQHTYRLRKCGVQHISEIIGGSTVYDQVIKG